MDNIINKTDNCELSTATNGDLDMDTDTSILADDYVETNTEINGNNNTNDTTIGIACSNNNNSTIDTISTTTTSTVQPVKYVNVTMTPSHFDLICCIGEGAFGKVLLVKPRLESTVTNTNSVYAMKVISKKLLKKKNHFSYMKAERDIMTKVSRT